MRKGLKKSLSLLLLVALLVSAMGFVRPDTASAGEPTPVQESDYKWVKLSTEMLLYTVAYGEAAGADIYWAASDYGIGTLSSSDLTSWRQQSIGNLTKPVNVMEYLNNNFIAGTEWWDPSQNGPAFLRSSDGLNWTVGTTLNDIHPFTVNSIAYHDGTYVAVLNNGKVALSDDGLNWGNGTTIGEGLNPYPLPYIPIFHDIAFIDGRFVAAGQKTDSNGNIFYAVAESQDGVIWEELQLIPLENAAMNYQASVAGFGSTIITARGPSVYRIDLSPNASQTFIPIPGLGNIQKVAYGDIDGGTFVAAGDAGNIRTSEDAITWVNESLPVYSGIIEDVIVADGTFIAVGGTGVYKRVKKAIDTTTTVTADPVSSEEGTSVTLTATVASTVTGDTVPTGTVTFTGPNGLSQAVPVNWQGQALYSAMDLTSGTITATYSGDTKFAGSSGTVSITVTPVPPHTIAPILDQRMYPLTQGYRSGVVQVINVTNTGSRPIIGMTATLSGDDADDFTLTQPGGVVYSSYPTSVMVQAKNGLNAGTYVATVTLSAPNLAPVSFQVTQVVNLPNAPVNPQLVTAVGGDHHVTVSWDSVTSATYYNVYMSTVSGQFGEIPVDTVTGRVYATVEDLSNGTAYYFVVKAGNPGGLSGASNQAQATPGIVPGAPVNVSAAAGPASAVVSFEAPSDSGSNPITGYEVTSSPGGIVATGTGSPITVTGLADGTAYTFTVKAINSTGSSVSSASSNSVTTAAVPSAPSAPTAVAGQASAVVSFEAPSDNGSPITGYEVTTSPGSIVATGTGTSITVTGLTNGTAYTFTAKAINAVGSSAASAPSNAVTPYAAFVAGPSGPSAPAAPKPADGVNVLVNGKEEQAGTATTKVVNDQTVTTITVNQQQLEEKLAAVGQGAVVTIPVNDASDVVVSELNGEMIKSMEDKEAILEIKTPYGSYTLPAVQLDIASISSQFGSAVTLGDIKIQIQIGAPTAAATQEAEQAAAQQSLTLVAPAVEFTVKATYGDSTVDVTKFNVYVERTIAISDEADPNKITTGVVFDEENGIRHVPTKVTKVEEQYYAHIKSLSNSLYSVVWNPLAFRDVEGHWAKDAVNDMGSRLVIDGVGSGLFQPDEDITRAEFAAAMVRGLGLKPAKGAAPFADVAASDWYHGVVKTASDYRLIDGFEDGTFRPEEKITREQAVVILARAMAVTKLEAKATAADGSELLKLFSDADQVSEWATASVHAGLETGLISGRSADELAPQANITRAEVAALIQRMLQESGLI